MANALEITRDEWLPFFDAFSGMHRGSPVTLEVVASGEEDELAADVPFENIAAESAERIAIVLRSSGGADEISHVVEAPEHVWLRQDESDTTAALEIQSSRGTTTRLRFAAGDLPRPPEGVVA
jgi:hypothetical protein